MQISTIAESLQKRFIEQRWTLSLAESCTGGSLAAALVQVPGASQYFLGSIVAYSYELKVNLLKVPPELIQKHGAVSREVVLAMLEGVLKATGSDFSIAISGIAGPLGGTENKPVGTVWAAIGNKDGLRHAFQWVEPGNRAQIIEGSVARVLQALLGIV